MSETGVSDAIALRLMLFPPKEMAKALDVVGVYYRRGSAYQILLSDGDHRTMVLGQLVAAAMKDHELHDGSSDLSSVTVGLLPDNQCALECRTPDNEAITDYTMRVVPVLTRSMEAVSPPSEMGRELYEICARAAREVAGLHMSLKNSTVGNLLAVMRIGEPCGGEVNGTMIHGIGWRMPDHRLLIQLRKAIASLD